MLRKSIIAPRCISVLSPSSAGSRELFIVGAVYVPSIALPLMSCSATGSCML